MMYQYILDITTDLLKYTSQITYPKKFESPYLYCNLTKLLCIISYVKVCFYNFYENKKKIEGN